MREEISYFTQCPTTFSTIREPLTALDSSDHALYSTEYSMVQASKSTPRKRTAVSIVEFQARKA